MNQVTMTMLNLKKQVVALLLLLICSLIPAANAAEPNMVRIHTWSGGKHFGPLIDESDDEVSVFDIAAATTVSLEKSTIKSKIEKIDEGRADSYVPFASYSAWKLGKILNSGRLEATVVHNSEKGVFVNCGSDDGIETNRRCVLLGTPEVIVDPTTNKTIGVVREQLGPAVPLTVVSDGLSKLRFPEQSDDDAQDFANAFALSRQVEIEQRSKRIMLAPPRWKPTSDAESLEDDANFLHAHLIAELVRYGFTVVSKKQTELTRQSIAGERQVESRDVSDIEIARNTKADVLVSVDMLAKGITCQVQLQVTDLKTGEYLGIVSGSVRRKDQKEESARAVAFAQGAAAVKQLGIRPNRTVVSLFALAERVNFNNDGSVTSLRWGGHPMTADQFNLLCQLESLKSIEYCCTDFTDAHLKQMANLTNLRHIGVWNTKITAMTCETIVNEFPSVTAINIGGTKALTERGASILATKQNLRSIYAFATNLTDKGLAHLATLPKLRALVIRNCKVTDQGLATLHECRSLSMLDIRKTGVSRQGVEKINAANPNCNVLSDF